MKKFIISTSIAIVALGCACYGYYSIRQQESDRLLMANIEALSNDDEPGYSETGTRYKCYTSTHYSEGDKVVICSSCEEVNNQTDYWYNIHDWCYR